MEIRSNNKAKHRSQKFAFGIFRLLSLCIVLILFAILGFPRRLWSPCPYWNTAPCAETDFVYRGKQRRRNVLRRCCFVYSCLPSGRNT